MDVLKKFAVTVLSLTDDEKKIVYGFMLGLRTQKELDKAS